MLALVIGECLTQSGLPALGLLKQLRHNSSPTGLVAGTDASACIAVEVLVKQRVVTPVRVGLKGLVRAEDRATPILSTHKNVRESTRELIGYLPERELLARTSGALH